MIESTNGVEKWSTVGVSENIIEASWQAMVDSINYLLLKESKKPESGCWGVGDTEWPAALETA